jgi:hypothetical protein
MGYPGKGCGSKWRSMEHKGRDGWTMKCRDASCDLGIDWERVGAVFALLQLIRK